MAGGGMGSWVREHVWEIPLRRYLSLVLAVALVAGGVFGVRTLMREARQCAPGVSRPAGENECLGVATGPYDFGQSQFSTVVDSIRKENSTLKKGSYVTVALMLPFTSTETTNLNDIEHQLQGAYLAQYWANNSDDQRPKIRLVLANSGTSKDSWKPAVDQLDRMTRSGDRLRAVVGIGQSTDSNQDAVAELTRLHIAVVGSSITADDLANGQPGKTSDPFPGLARVAPTNTDEAHALASFVQKTASKPTLVYDHPGDPYTNSLKESLTSLLNIPYTRQLSFERFDAPTEFSNIVPSLCSSTKGTRTILFAGRHTQLRQFLNALGGSQGCPDNSFQVLTGDEASYLTYDKDLNRAALADHGVSLLYTSLAHPDAWVTKNPPATGGSAADYGVLRGLLDSDKRGPIGAIRLDDGQLIIGYDAMRLAVEGIHRAVLPGDATTENQLKAVGRAWPSVQGPRKVHGASGWICLDGHGNPSDKAVPIVQLDADQKPKFIQLAWPLGRPPHDNCPMS